MNSGKYVFSQITDFLPKRYFERLVMMISNDRTQGWNLTHWNQMLVLMFGQLDGSNSLRELTDITTAHAKKSFHLGFGKNPINSFNKIHTQLDIVPQIPVSFYITEAAVHDVKGMNWINYEPELKRTFTYYTNNFFLKAKDIAFLYKNR